MKFRSACTTACVLAVGLALSACSEEPAGGAADDTDIDVATTDGEAEAMSRALEAGDFAGLSLGAKIDGPQGPEPVGRLTTPEGAFADMTSYVACPDGVQTCVPADAPEGTVYTYVHIVYPGEDNDASTGSGEGPDSSDVEAAKSFGTTRPVHGFTGSVGYSQAELQAAAGADARMVVTCSADGGLLWTIDTGDGGDQWERGEPITFWWQSTVPPAGPQDAYAIDADGTTATGSGPFPDAAQGARNACLDPSTAS